jgi:FtsP/CotA-like multicopper oxidase with cupredoxin domain
MKMMNDMMKMNGDLDDMGMSMSLNKMDMNVVMYPEITGEEKPEMDGMKTDDMKMGDKKTTVKKTDTKMDGMKMDDKKTTVKKSDTKMDGMKMDMGKEKMDANMYNGNALSDIKTLNYAMLKSPTKTNLPSNAPMRVLKFELTGNMNRYLWSMDGKTVSETDKILIKQGENIRIILYNGSMMRHPMHLHGHFFRVLNGQGDYAPLKNVLDIMPMETDTIEFNASEKSGDWFFHCHILYHMMSGMGRIFQYENSIPNPELGDKKAADRQVFKDVPPHGE